MYVEAMEARGIPVSRARPGGPPGKGYILASSASLRLRIRGWARQLGLEVQGHSAQLGVDSSGGAPVRVRRRFDERLSSARGRKQKLSSLAKQGARPFKVARMGFMPSVLYGAACLGLDPTRVDQARVLMASALGGSSIGKDRALRLWILKCDPLVDACTRPLVKWATAVWEGRHEDLMTTVWRLASAAAALAKPGTSI